jgi:hypothetical protein
MRLISRYLAAGVLLLGLPAGVFASAAEIDEIADMQSVGEARMQVLFWRVYDARLLAPEGRWDAAEPFALSLTYLRSLDGEKIAARSIQEIRGQGFTDEATLARWYEVLARIIPDVQERNEIVGVAGADGATRFYLDGALIGEIREPAFTRAFFAIWLGERSSEPALRDQLLGAL